MARKINGLLRSARINVGFTQEGLADALGVSANSISRWERGENIPTAFFRQRLCLLFQLSEQDLGWADRGGETCPKESFPFLLDPCLPAPGIALVGQQALMQELAHSHRQIIGLTGLAGCGKTAIVQALATFSTLKEQHAGVFWATVGQHSTPLRHLQRWSMLLGRETLPEGLEEAQDRLRVMIGTQKIIVVLDDLWSAHDISSYRLGPHCRYILTTRHPGLAATVCDEVYQPEPLTNGQAFSVLVSDLPDALIREHHSVLHALCQQVGNLPLAVAQMGTYLRYEARLHSPRRFQEALTHLFHAKTYLNIQMPPGETSLSALLQQSEMGLPVSTRQAFLALAAHFPAAPARFSEQDVASFFHTAQQSALTELDCLIDAGLITSVGQNHYHIHPVISAYARQASHLLERGVE